MVAGNTIAGVFSFRRRAATAGTVGRRAGDPFQGSAGQDVVHRSRSRRHRVRSRANRGLHHPSIERAADISPVGGRRRSSTWRITHVIRGDDHISNTPKHILLWRALGQTPPEFAHIPLILGTDKKRLSKRHGATSVTEYERLGYLPEAMVNFLGLLGWSPGGDRELMSRRRTDRGVYAGRHQRRRRRFQSGEAGLVQRAVPRATDARRFTAACEAAVGGGRTMVGRV